MPRILLPFLDELEAVILDPKGSPQEAVVRLHYLDRAGRPTELAMSLERALQLLRHLLRIRGRMQQR